MRWQLIAGTLAGCIAGAALGFYGKCLTGTPCPFIDNPTNGGIYGTFMGFMLTYLLMTAFSRDYSEAKLSRNFHSIKNEKAFNEQVLREKGVSLVLFFAEWCGPSSLLMPTISSISDIFKNKVKVFRVDVEKFPSLKVRQDIKSVPIVVIYKDGEEMEKLPGPFPESTYIEKLNKHLSDS